MGRLRRSRKRFLGALRGLGERRWPGLRRGGAWAAWCLLVAGAAPAAMVLVPRLEGLARAAHDGRRPAVVFTAAPAWVNGDLRAHLELTAAGRISGDPMVREGLVTARQALLETGWFSSVRQVRRTGPDQVEVDGDFVQPYAIVRDRDGDHLVDPTGRLLPRSVPVGSTNKFRVIHGAHFDRPDRAGAPWPGGDITAALRLSRLVDEHPWASQVVGLDVSDHASQHGLALITNRNQRIVWGRAPGEEAAGEASTKRKLQYLDYPFEHFGHIDGGYEGTLDLTSPVGVFGR